VFTGTLNVPSAGPVTFTITSDDGFILGVGNGATRVSGALTNTPGSTAFKSYAVLIKKVSDALMSAQVAVLVLGP